MSRSHHIQHILGSVALMLLVASFSGCSGDAGAQKKPASAAPLQIATFPKPTAGPHISGSVGIQGELASVDGCVVLKNSASTLIAFNPDHARVDGDTVVLTALDPGKPELRLAMGDVFKGGGSAIKFARAVDLGYDIPPACQKFNDQEIYLIESW